MIRTRLAVLVLLGTAVTAACRDSTPMSPASSPGALTTDALTMELRAVTRVTPLANDLTASASIGAGGGTIRLAAVGLVVTIPRGALATTQTITVTAPAGSNVAYLFQPHGLVFAKPVKLEQDLRYAAVGQIASGSIPMVGYVADDQATRDAAPGGTMPVNEILPASIDAKGARVAVGILHFSGYMVSSGGLVPPEELP